jgi:Putative prokaryotic signal transducing protein
LSPNSDLIEIYVARGEAEANVIKGLLDCYGIPNILKAQASPSVHVFTIDGMGQISIWVRKEDAEDARELIKGEQE